MNTCTDPKCPCRFIQNKPPKFGTCVLQNLMMVIPPDGVHLYCPYHEETHFIMGSQNIC